MDRLAILEKLIEEYNPYFRNITAETTFEELEMDSYAMVDFLMKAEEEFDVVISDDRMLSMKNLQDVLDTIENCSEEDI